MSAPTAIRPSRGNIHGSNRWHRLHDGATAYCQCGVWVPDPDFDTEPPTRAAVDTIPEDDLCRTCWPTKETR